MRHLPSKPSRKALSGPLALTALTLTLTSLVGFGQPAVAASFDDPEWPCIQRKVPHLSIGQMWSGPAIDEAVEARAKDREIIDLAGRLAVRRTALEGAESLIDAFAKAHASDREPALAGLFLATFERIERDRSAIIAGIGRYAKKQTALSEQIDRRRTELHDLRAVTEPDHDRIEELDDQVTWDTRIFEDRRQSLTYVCETPVILEQRIFALARMILQRLEE
ncbi:hypothetical protein [Polymorphum gilvum]|uniref:Uncharacterized protein n=1 Tax=Polymorphum gilvum (strain LMG 25793 / CGMCC 1.9160 / SL003B-26A1) TaxID=991905 RepID=F2IXW0_POLGS|nr:hypothetical protein [Polymorphum gilvum]ADZ69441.1 hypothetical protein SL003B_1012 [Polymorphum gilvum SL003B-26A1]